MNPADSYEQYAQATYVRWRQIGLPEVQFLSGASTEEMSFAEKESTEYLSECPNDLLYEFAERVSGLYALVPNPTHRIRFRDVDVFARSFLNTLEQPERNLDANVAQQLGRTVLFARYASTVPSLAIHPFDVSTYRKLIFST